MAIQINLMDESGSRKTYAMIKDARFDEQGQYADVDVALYMDADARRVDIEHDILTVRLSVDDMGGTQPTRADIYAALKRKCDLFEGCGLA